MLTVEIEQVALTAALTVKLEVALPAWAAGAARQRATAERPHIERCFAIRFLFMRFLLYS
jgi:hypothetical protein